MRNIVYVIVTLLRHYKVNHLRNRKYRPSSYLGALKEYDKADVTDQHTVLAIKYQKIITSTMKRSIQTFGFIYGNAKHEQTNLLDEVPMVPFTDKNKEYNATYLDVMARIQWMLNNKRQPETRIETKERVSRFINEYLRNDENVLVIGHGFYMRLLSKELIRRGFKGQQIEYIRKGEYYTYIKE